VFILKNLFVSCLLKKEDKVFSQDWEPLISEWGAIEEDRNTASIIDFVFSSAR